MSEEEAAPALMHLPQDKSRKMAKERIRDEMLA